MDLRDVSQRDDLSREIRLSRDRLMKVFQVAAKTAPTPNSITSKVTTFHSPNSKSKNNGRTPRCHQFLNLTNHFKHHYHTTDTTLSFFITVRLTSYGSPSITSTDTLPTQSLPIYSSAPIKTLILPFQFLRPNLTHFQHPLFSTSVFSL